MNQQKSRNDLIDEKLDNFNASAALDGKDLSKEELDKIKTMLKDGLTPEECIKKVIEGHLGGKQK